MRRTYVPAVAAGAFMIVAGATTAMAQDASRAVAGGGITLAGWAGKIDASEAGKGAKLEDAKLAKMGNDMHVTTGPAVAYWNPANKATGDYTVKAKFTESKYMGLNDHPHPYGRSEEHTSELQSQSNLVCRLLLEKKKETNSLNYTND